MFERWETHDEHGRVIGYVMKETSHSPATFSQGPRPCQSESPCVEAICRIVGLIMFAITGLLLWIMATAA
jgi:hypothetical protein